MVERRESSPNAVQLITLQACVVRRTAYAKPVRERVIRRSTRAGRPVEHFTTPLEANTTRPSRSGNTYSLKLRRPHRGATLGGGRPSAQAVQPAAEGRNSECRALAWEAMDGSVRLNRDSVSRRRVHGAPGRRTASSAKALARRESHARRPPCLCVGGEQSFALRSAEMEEALGVFRAQPAKGQRRHRWRSVNYSSWSAALGSG